MADVPGKFYRATKVRTGVAPSSAGSIEGEVLPPVNPPGSSLNSVGLTMPSAFTVSNSPLTANGTIGVAGAGTVAQYIRGDGSLADFPESSGGGSSVSYYLNGSVNQGTIGGIAYKELSKVPILGAGTDFTINADGYIASFITDAGDPNLLEIPGGNWNFETYFSASSSGGTPTFYVELYKVSGTTATLIASSSSAPELIAFGTNLNPYFSTLAVPTTTLALTDRLAVRYYVTHSGRTITLHTENNHLCQIITTFTTGLTALNGLTAQVQNFAVGTTGTDFNIASATATHTFNLPTASATNRGALSSADWALFTQAYNDKINSAAVTGTTTKTLTLTQQDGGTITASWSDLNTDAVLSVFGRTGAVVAANGDYTTAQVTESGNLYYTDARSRAALSFAAGSGAYNTSTGVITIPTNNNQIANGAGYITSAALSGYVQGSGSAGQVAYWSSASAITGESALFWDASNNRLGIDNASPDAPIHANGGASMTAGWNRTATLQAQYPVLVYNSNGSKWGGIGYDHTSGLIIWVNSSSSDVSSGTNALFINNIGAANFSSSVTAKNASTSASVAQFSIMGAGEFISTGSLAGLFWENRSGGVTSNSNWYGWYTSAGIIRLYNGSTDILEINGSSGAATFDSSITATSIIRSGGTSSQYLMADGSVSTLSNPVTGTGTTNYLPKFTGSTTIGNSQIFDNGTNVGIGTSSPSSLLHLQNSSGPTLRLVRTSNRFDISADNDFMEINARDASTYMIFKTADTERARITSSGNLLVGTTTDNGARLQVSGAGVAFNFTTSNGLIGNINSSAANGGYVTWQTSGTTIADLGTAQQVFGAGGNDTFGINGRGARSLTFGTNNTKRMEIGAGGEMSFNTSSVSVRSYLFKALAGRQLAIEALESGGVHSIYLRPSSSGRNLITSNYFSGGVYLPLALSGRENDTDFVLNTNGNVLIGTTTDNGARLQVSGGATVSGDILVAGTYNPYASTNRGNITLNGTSSNILAFTNNSAGRGYILHNGTDMEVQNVSSGTIRFFVASGEAFRVNSGRSILTYADLAVGGKINGFDLTTLAPTGTNNVEWRLGRALVATSVVTEDRWIRVQLGNRIYDILAIDRGLA